LLAGDHDLQELAKTYHQIVLARKRLADSLLNHYLPLYFSEMGLPSGVVGNTGFEATPFVSVTVVLRAIARLTARGRRSSIAPSRRSFVCPLECSPGGLWTTGGRERSLWWTTCLENLPARERQRGKY
jgi:hypothetical protein